LSSRIHHPVITDAGTTLLWEPDHNLQQSIYRPLSYILTAGMYGFVMVAHLLGVYLRFALP
jgi:hypothetical protein